MALQILLNAGAKRGKKREKKQVERGELKGDASGSKLVKNNAVTRGVDGNYPEAMKTRMRCRDRKRAVGRHTRMPQEDKTF